jgi:hypothetical protein
MKKDDFVRRFESGAGVKLSSQVFPTKQKDITLSVLNLSFLTGVNTCTDHCVTNTSVTEANQYD